MSTLLQQYHAASSLSVQTVLKGIVNAGPSPFDQASRSELIESLLKDLNAADSRISSKDNALALLALKTLGQDPTGAEALGTVSNLSILLELVISTKHDTKASNEALRCIANTLLLAGCSRSVFIDPKVKGSETCISLLETPSPFIVSLVEEKRNGNTVIDILGRKVDLLLPSVTSGNKIAREAMVEVLKLTMRIFIHYLKYLDSKSEPDDASDNWCSNLDSIVPPLLRVFRALLPTSPSPIVAPLTNAIHTLIWIPVSLFPTDTILQTHSLLENAFLHYFPDALDPDDPSVRELAMSEAGPGSATDSSPLDLQLGPLVALIARQCVADETARTRTRDWLCPADLDRSAAAGSLESRPDMLGRCLRLLGSVYHPQLKSTVGQMLFAMCNSDAATMSTLLGYGNVAGFLFSMNIMSAPPAPAPSATTPAAVSAAAAENINPITGTAQEARPPDPEMSSEEKEREMEKLFVLFDRLERTGTLPPSQNPIRRAIEKAANTPSLPDKDDEE
ncbi:hypothetical protein MVEN_01945300 [Mycena venus]|uniref:Guanine nucleotide exchange factor n=1 Tax=Mycena venus TaxID=2733690 RepID=A0A8H6XGZ0_9AGAR|nr:hypothetical protein MVEN_01945300 [Mycena venus]